MLTPRSIQVLKRILLIDEVFTFKQVALDLDLSEKTVRNQLDEIQEFLMTYRLSLKTVPGTGSQILGNQSDKADAYAAIVGVNASNQLLRTKDRLTIILYRLLNSDRACYVHEFEAILFVSRSSLYNDLKEADQWLSKMKIGLVINRKKGISLITGEKRTRLALVKLLSEIDLDFVSLFPQDLQLYLQNTLGKDSRHQRLAQTILEKLEHDSGLIFEPEEALRLRLNLLVSFNRISRHHTVTLSSEVVKRLQDTLWIRHLASCLEIIKQGFGIELIPEEIYYLSGILLSSKSRPIDAVSPEDLDQKALSIADAFTETVTSIISLPRSSNFHEDIRLHILSVLQKSQFIWECVNPIKTQIREQFPNSYKLASSIAPLFLQYANLDINDDEIAYVAMHIMSALEQARKPLRTLFIFDKTPSEVRYAIAMIKNHIAEVKIVKLIQTKDITKELCDEAELILSAFPLPKSITKPTFIVPLIPDNRYLTQLKSQIALLYETLNDDRIIGGTL